MFVSIRRLAQQARGLRVVPPSTSSDRLAMPAAAGACGMVVTFSAYLSSTTKAKAAEAKAVEPKAAEPKAAEPKAAEPKAVCSPAMMHALRHGDHHAIRKKTWDTDEVRGAWRALMAGDVPYDRNVMDALVRESWFSAWQLLRPCSDGARREPTEKLWLSMDDAMLADLVTHSSFVGEVLTLTMDNFQMPGTAMARPGFRTALERLVAAEDIFTLSCLVSWDRQQSAGLLLATPHWLRRCIKDGRKAVLQLVLLRLGEVGDAPCAQALARISRLQCADLFRAALKTGDDDLLMLVVSGLPNLSLTTAPITNGDVDDVVDASIRVLKLDPCNVPAKRALQLAVSSGRRNRLVQTSCPVATGVLAYCLHTHGHILQGVVEAAEAAEAALQDHLFGSLLALEGKAWVALAKCYDMTLPPGFWAHALYRAIRQGNVLAVSTVLASGHVSGGQLRQAVLALALGKLQDDADDGDDKTWATLSTLLTAAVRHGNHYAVATEALVAAAYAGNVSLVTKLLAHPHVRPQEWYNCALVAACVDVPRSPRSRFAKTAEDQARMAAAIAEACHNLSGRWW